MRVLSLFDGMACAYSALRRAGIRVSDYYAVELASAKHARTIADANFNIMRPCDDVRKFDKSHAAQIGKIDLLVAGFPCQAFSVAGRLGGLDDERGALLYDAMRIIRLVKPRRWILENVKPPKAMASQINQIIGTAPVVFNSKFYGAQNRPRAFWVNAPLTAKEAPCPLTLGDIMLSESDAEAIAQRKYPYVKFHKPIGAAVLIIGTTRIAAKEFGIKDRTTYGVTARAGKFGALKVNSNYPTAQISETQARRLTITECLRLQNLPDNYCPGNIPKTPALAAIGNGMDVAVLADIVRQVTQ